MKRVISIILTALIAMLALFGCNNAGENAGKEAVNTVSDEQISETPEAATEPETEKQTEEDTELNVIDVVGMTKDTAVSALKNEGFAVKVLEEYSDSVEKDYVIKQIPTVENKLTLNKGDTVTLYVSLGKDESKAYLTKILYMDEKSDSKANSFSIYDGEDYDGSVCSNAIKLTISEEKDNYPDEIKEEGFETYSLSYDVEKYNKFSAEFTHLGLGAEDSKLELLCDDKTVFSQGVSDNTEKFDLNIDTSSAKIFTIRITVKLVGLVGYDKEYIFNNAYFE